MWIYAYWILFGLSATTGLETSEWLNSFINYLKVNNIEYQVLLLYDGIKGTNEYYKVQDIVQGISTKLPALKISFQEATIEKAHVLSQSSSVLYNPRTTMIVIIHFSISSMRMADLNQTLTIVSQISVARRRSRCLIILPREEERFTYLGLLERLWSNQFLDVTILELEEPKRKKWNYFSNSTLEIARLHQFNPFTKRYDNFKYSKMTHWFPEKTHNLHDLKMKVGVINYPPSIFLTRNSTGHVAEVVGLDISLTDTFSKAMNFNVDWVDIKNDHWRIGRCKKNIESGVLKRLVYNEIQYVAMSALRPSGEVCAEWSRDIRVLKHIVVVPIFSKKSVLLLNMWKIANAILLVIVFLSTWLVTRMLPFERHNWKFLQIVRIVLGTSTLHEPQRMAERIVFGSMLFSCLLYSSIIHTALTDVSLHSETEPEMNTISDVVHSSLEPVISNVYYSGIIRINDGSKKIFLEKATKVNSSSQECLARLLQERNLACITRSDFAEWMIENNRDRCGRPRMKILQDPLQTPLNTIVMEARSPYVQQFDKVLLRLVQSGIPNKWQRERFNQSSLIVDKGGICSEREATSSKLETQFVYLFIFNYACATAIFVCEVICDYLTKKVN